VRCCLCVKAKDDTTECEPGECLMDNPRPEKVAVIDEVKERLNSSSAALLTEYRGLTVADMQTLRRSLRAAGGDYKIYKNTLVRFAARDLGLDIEALLVGPTAIAFVPNDGPGDPVPVAKALKDFARTNTNLVLKGGVLGDKVLSAEDTKALADVAPREQLLAQLAGAMAAPMQQFAGLLNALPQKFAYAMQALIDQGGDPGVANAAASESEQLAPESSTSPESAQASDADAPDTTESTHAPAEAASTDSGDSSSADLGTTTEES